MVLMISILSYNIIIIIRRFIKRRSSEGNGAVHVFNVLAAIIEVGLNLVVPGCYVTLFTNFAHEFIYHYF